MRPEIQALRAVAVLLVVLYHLWPAAIPGGFVGVDVFFAISGFLITGLLVRELEERGTVSLPAFWARRARRLLPAAFATIAVCAVATAVLVPVTQWDAFFGEIRAATLYVENWELSAGAVDYFADERPSPVRHFWTLSAEEQFYLAWPLLLLLPALALRRRPSRRVLALLLGTVTAASFAYALHVTATAPHLAYFGTPARAWEFGLGGLLALAATGRGGRSAVRVVLSWAGLAAIVAAALLFDGGTPFPGTAALLPVGGALAVMAAGMPAGRGTPAPLLRPAPVQRIGDLSYAMYLWHWPLIVLAPYALGHAVDTPTAIAILALTILASGLTRRLVEEPVRRGAFARRAARWTFAAAVPATAVLAGVTVAAGAEVDRRAAEQAAVTRATLADAPRCFGAASRDPRRPCRNPRLAELVVPRPVEAQRQGNAPCEVVERRGRMNVCAFGAPPQRARSSVVVLGDSHAAHWRAALAPGARAERWRGLSITRTGCQFTAATPAIEEPARTHCRTWNRDVGAWFAEHPEIETVIVAARAGADVQGGGRRMVAAGAAGYARAWRDLPPTVRRIVVLRDTPRMRARTVDCVQEALDAGRLGPRTCAVPRPVALLPDPQVLAASRVRDRDARVIDLTPALCDRRSCLAVIGGALAFRDEDHLTPTFGATLAPQVRRALDPVLG